MSDPILEYVHDVTTTEFLAAVVERSRTVPVLVDFWATWCAPCRALGPVLERLAKEYAGGFELAKVDTDREQALSAQFQIRSIPTVMLFRDAKPVAGFPGALPEGQIRAFLSKHGVEPGGAAAVPLSDDPAARETELRALIAAHPERDALRLDLALAVLANGHVEEAATLLEALPSASYTDPKAMRARAAVSLRRRLVTATGVHAEAMRAVLAGDTATGLAQLIELLREEKHDEHSPARAALVDALQMIDDEAVVRDGRRRMAAVLF